MKPLRLAGLGLATVVALFAFSGTAKADHYGPYHPYTYGHNGYWDEHHRHHNWSTYHDHQGYWYHRNDGVRVWINL